MVAELGVKPRIVATGGLAHQISADSRFISEIDDMHTLDGLVLLFERNRAPRARNRTH
jgi:type III pantothenate kinase